MIGKISPHGTSLESRVRYFCSPDGSRVVRRRMGDIAMGVRLRTGLSDGQDDEGVRRIDKGVRWIALRHAADHTHVVAMLARQDGRRPRLSFDRL